VSDFDAPLPPKSDPRWRKLVVGEIEYRSSRLATNMLLLDATLAVRRDPSPRNVDRQLATVYTYFLTNRNETARDLERIFAA